MNVLEGERYEQRRIAYQGRPEWTTVDGEELVLMDGRRIAEAEADLFATLRSDQDPLHPSQL